MFINIKKDFLLGAATAATQIEGGECGHNWNDWFHQGKIKDGANPARANEHYNRWREDIDLMSKMDLKVYRFGIEWARLCPTPDQVDQEVIAHYRQEIQYIQKKGILPLLTIHHFTNPMWFENVGGFANVENIKYYMNLVALVVRSFGDLISEYITINEPNVYATSSFYFGDWPPGDRSLKKALVVMSNLSVCHIRAYKMIHQLRSDMGYKDTKVSFANHMRVFEPANRFNPWHRFCTVLIRQIFQDAVSKAMTLGKFEWPLKKTAPVERGEYCDFIAINYYSRTAVSGFKDGVKKGVKKNDLDWEIYPDGIIQVTEQLYQLLKRPIYITENGTCDNEDTFRCRYLYDHLKVISESNLPIERYYHWCFCDNFEWIEGEQARFGLVHINYETQKRTIKHSGSFYSEVIHASGVSEELYEKYVKNQIYHD